MDYARPTELEEALGLLCTKRWTILAGGTDFYPALGAGPLKSDVLDINGLSALSGIEETETHFVIGARTSWSAVIAAELPPAFDMLKQAAREVGSVQIQNTGTVAGNLCNASPAADGVPPLRALDAEVELRSVRGVRYLPLANFILGNRKTARADDELLTAIRVPKRASQGASSFVKLGARRYLVISIAMAAARVVPDGAKVVETAISVGSCSAVAQRLSGLESRLEGAERFEMRQIVMDYAFPELSPIDDVRGTAAYRREAAREIVIRALEQAWQDAGHSEVAA
ncbi:CO or xanthine dehydrogenase, FAD-binding subunit [Nitratireductor aquibiodomus]|uniref:CO or xanthine dehydrogenase, FAD-binding subunit n=1 Tax=Nitratireductor aquibiodomus TaxID=204799 RepID=A0A1H4JXN0_9HYPH|nr:xanthine dehydrogenase family protein subunit M [Nitratireductor aquibiodomus]SEB50766.1 CO or xanthine dehydrogenase, FAD-binding subunit [Nitratireductor aquibiodomus]